MSYITYQDRKGYTVHHSSCGHLRKHGGSKNYEYEKFDSLDDAEQHLRHQGEEPRYCSACMK